MKHLFSVLFFAVLFSVQSIHAQTANKEWTFVSKVYDADRSIKQGQKITVKWHGLSGLKTSKGSLKDITVDSLTLSIADQIVCIAKKDIEEIAAKKYRTGKKILGVLLFLAGLIMAGFFTLILLVTITAEVKPGEKKQYYWPWVFLGLGIMALGLVNLRSPIIHTSKPFSKEWTIQEKPTKTNKTP